MRFSTLFFFSSRRRHTRSTRDWSSDVCSSDLCLNEFVVHRENRSRCANERSFPPLFSKTHVVRPGDPTDEDGGKSVKSHKRRVDGPFSFHDTGVHDDETGNTLETDQRG